MDTHFSKAIQETCSALRKAELLLRTEKYIIAARVAPV